MKHKIKAGVSVEKHGLFRIKKRYIDPNHRG